MQKSRKEGGLGLPIICEGREGDPPKSRRGGYGDVYPMRLPPDASGVDEIKAAGRLVSKIIIMMENSR